MKTWRKRLLLTAPQCYSQLDPCKEENLPGYKTRPLLNSSLPQKEHYLKMDS